MEPARRHESGERDRLRALIEIGEGGRPFIRGTDVEAYRIAALVQGGMDPDEVLHDYPGLEADQLWAAVAYAEQHPNPGRPYPTRTAKSVLRRGTGGLRHILADPGRDL